MLNVDGEEVGRLWARTYLDVCAPPGDRSIRLKSWLFASREVPLLVRPAGSHALAAHLSLWATFIPIALYFVCESVFEAGLHLGVWSVAWALLVLPLCLPLFRRSIVVKEIATPSSVRPSSPSAASS
jgi:hypothetical protein